MGFVSWWLFILEAPTSDNFYEDAQFLQRRFLHFQAQGRNSLATAYGDCRGWNGNEQRKKCVLIISMQISNEFSFFLSAPKINLQTPARTSSPLTGARLQRGTQASRSLQTFYQLSCLQPILLLGSFYLGFWVLQYQAQLELCGRKRLASHQHHLCRHLVYCFLSIANFSTQFSIFSSSEVSLPLSLSLWVYSGFIHLLSFL